MNGSVSSVIVAKSSGMVRGSILPHFKDLAAELNLDTADLANQAGISRQCLEDSEQILHVRAIVQLLELAASTSGISDLGLRLAEARGLPDMGPVNLIIREETTVRSALHTLIELIHLHTDAACISLDEHANCAILDIDILGCSGIGNRQAIDVSVAQVTSVIRWLLGESWTPAAICFTHSAPTSTERYRRFFRCTVDFLCDHNAIVIGLADLQRKVPGASPMLRRQVEHYLQMLSLPKDRFDLQVTKLIMQGLPKGEASIETVAMRLGTTTRTLHRRLASCCLTFSGILNEARKDLATHHLSDNVRLISEVSDLLGFSSPGAFSAWFRRSFGSAPRSWRLRRNAKPNKMH